MGKQPSILACSAICSNEEHRANGHTNFLSKRHSYCQLRSCCKWCANRLPHKTSASEALQRKMEHAMPPQLPVSASVANPFPEEHGNSYTTRARAHSMPQSLSSLCCTRALAASRLARASASALLTGLPLLAGSLLAVCMHKTHVSGCAPMKQADP